MIFLKTHLIVRDLRCKYEHVCANTENSSSVIKTFTLVELLVVIAIIAILASFLMPAVKHSLSMGHAVSCANSQKQIGIAAFQYSGEWNERSLYLSTNTSQQWFFGLRSYLHLSDETSSSYAKLYGKIGCPESPRFSEEIIYYSFGINSAANVDNWLSIALTVKPVAYAKLSKIKRPSSHFYFLEGNNTLLNYAGAEAETHYLVYPEDSTTSGQKNNTCYRHNLKANILFYDSHVSSHYPDYTYDMVASSTNPSPCWNKWNYNGVF